MQKAVMHGGGTLAEELFSAVFKAELGKHACRSGFSLQWKIFPGERLLT